MLCHEAQPRDLGLRFRPKLPTARLWAIWRIEVCHDVYIESPGGDMLESDRRRAIEDAKI
jgi:hypothetical protein